MMREIYATRHHGWELLYETYKSHMAHRAAYWSSRYYGMLDFYCEVYDVETVKVTADLARELAGE